jgi:hypothetical protein
MPYVGIHRRAGAFHPTEPHAANSETVWFSDTVMDAIMENPAGHQDILCEAYETNHTGFFKDLWSIFRTENAYWHIHGIIATSTLFFAIVYPIGLYLGLDVEGPYLPPATVGFLAAAAVGTSLFSFYALYRRVRRIKKAAALYLFTNYLFFISFFIIEGVPNVFQFITTVAFAMILAVVHREWSR